MTIRLYVMAVLAAAAGCLISAALPLMPLGIAVMAVAASALLFAVFSWLFDSILWKWSGIPDISGTWAYDGIALNPDGSILYPWTAQVRIAQRGERLAVRLETAKSRSVSRAASLRSMPGGGVKLLYDYESDPAHDATASHAFFGVTQFVFDRDARKAEGVYFNYNGRYTHGRTRLTRIRRDG